jgi:hypothetical protein
LNHPFDADAGADAERKRRYGVHFGTRGNVRQVFEMRINNSFVFANYVTVNFHSKPVGSGWHGHCPSLS